ncbi:uncharacterized protein, partial [Heptranchias perlo]|uniref:uncharacterized protein n=2 Tax=Heptranchias perlo TaxID=212740 RepID=UPI003559CDA9
TQTPRGPPTHPTLPGVHIERTKVGDRPLPPSHNTRPPIVTVAGPGPGIRCPWKPRRNRATRERPQARLPVPGLRPLPDSQSPASGPSPTPSPRPQAPPRLPVPGLRPLPDSQTPASGPSPTPRPRPQAPPRLPVPGLRPSPTPSPRPQAPPRLPVPGLRPLPDSQSPVSGPSPTPSPRPQAPPRLPVPGLRPSPPPPALLLPLAALNQLLAAGAISFQLPSNARKCLREEIHKDRLVTDSSGHILYSKEEATKGKFAFTTDDYDMFEICFESRLPPDRLSLSLSLPAQIAKAEKPLEVELRRLEDLSESIVNDFAYMKQREEEMRDTNESTSARVLYFSIFSMCCLVGLATWQVFYLRRFFKAKKLIE